MKSSTIVCEQSTRHLLSNEKNYKDHYQRRDKKSIQVTDTLCPITYQTMELFHLSIEIYQITQIMTDRASVALLSRVQDVPKCLNQK